jgi:hypothetical protein
MIEGSGSIPLTNGSGYGSRRLKNMWIRWIRIQMRIRIRIRNIELERLLTYVDWCSSPGSGGEVGAELADVLAHPPLPRVHDVHHIVQVGPASFLLLSAVCRGIRAYAEISLRQCCGSVTFLCGSGSPDPHLLLMDPDPTSFFSDFVFKDAKKITFFSYRIFFL